MSSETALKLPEKTSSDNFLQIDILKGIMIMLVIIDHAIPREIREGWANSLWERISIPVFLIIMGFNAANSFKKNDVPLSSFKSFLQYCFRKIKRYLIPFALLYLLSTIFGLIKYGGFESLLHNQFDDHWSRDFLWLLILPFYGPGNWFISVVFQSVIIMPFLYWGYKKSPKITLFLSVIWEIGFYCLLYAYFGHSITYYPDSPPSGYFMLRLSVIGLINAIVIGFWFADHQDIGSGSILPEQNNLVMTQDETQETTPKDIETPRKKIPYHFYLVLLSVIVICSILIRTVFLDTENEARSIGLTILLIFLVIGLYCYRPLLEFLIIFIISLVLVIIFAIAIEYYNESVIIDYSTFTVNPRWGIFFLNMAIFILPYFINIFYSPKNKNWFIWILFLLSGTYLLSYQYIIHDDYFNFRYFLMAGDYHFLVYPHSAFIVLLFLKMIPKKSNFVLFRGFAYVGKATYHILLTQIFVYGIMLSTVGDHYFGEAFVNRYLDYSSNYILAVWIYVIIIWLICIPIGILWYLIEKKVFSYIKQTRRRKEQIQAS